MQLVANVTDLVSLSTFLVAVFENSFKILLRTQAFALTLHDSSDGWNQKVIHFSLPFALLSTAIPTLVCQASLRTSRQHTASATPSNYMMKRSRHIRMRRESCVMVPAWRLVRLMGVRLYHPLTHGEADKCLWIRHGLAGCPSTKWVEITSDPNSPPAFH